MNRRLPTVHRIHQLALFNALRRADFAQVNYLRKLSSTGGGGLGNGEGGAWAWAIRRQIDSVSGKL